MFLYLRTWNNLKKATPLRYVGQWEGVEGDRERSGNISYWGVISGGEEGFLIRGVLHESPKLVKGAFADFAIPNFGGL